MRCERRSRDQMTSPPEQIRVRCPKCGHEYEDWIRPSINLMMDDFDQDYLDEASSVTCPECKHRMSVDILIVREDGVWEFGKNEGS